MFLMASRLRTTAGLAESHAWGGGKRWLVAATAQVKLPSCEPGKPTCEGRSPLGLPMGRCQALSHHPALCRRQAPTLHESGTKAIDVLYQGLDFPCRGYQKPLFFDWLPYLSVVLSFAHWYQP
jgi:hypothetical protein